MFKKRYYTVLALAIMLALLAGSLPMSFSTAMGNLQGTQPNCPPFNPTLTNDPGFIESLSKECRVKYKQPVSPQISSLKQMTLFAGGGPDDFGYTFDDTVPFDWISASNLTSAAGDDASGALTQLEFNIPFYGNTFSGFYFTTNGLIVFDQPACCVYGGSNIPSLGNPNNLIAPFWDDLVVGDIYNTGGIYWDTGGSAPNRYFVIEWRDVTTYAGSAPFSFEAILYENGDILLQHQSLPASYYSTVGIENGSGDDGLEYQVGDAGLTAPKAIKFFYPNSPTGRVAVSPLDTGKFASTSGNTNFPITITNIGSAGIDTYDLVSTSAWAIGLYQDGCVMPLADTDGDTVIDTGPLTEGTATTICVAFTAPSSASIGDENSASVTVTSSLNPIKTKTATLSMVIPAPFVQVFEDYVDAAMAFEIIRPDGLLTDYATNDFYYGNGLATIDLPDGSYFYAWRKPDGNYPNSFSDIEYTMRAHNGIVINLPVTKLTSNVGTGQTYDYQPAVAVTPNGTIGVTWYRWLVDNTTNQYNYNIYFATLSKTGTLLYGPVNVTNNNLWDRYNNINAPHFFSPAIAATGDNRFVLSWNEYRTDGVGSFLNNIGYATRDSTGTNIFPPTALTSDGSSYNPILNQLTGNNSILTWVSNLIPYYAVINSNGSISKAATALNGLSYQSTDAVTLPNGTIAVGWATTGPEIAYVMVDASYNVIVGPSYANNPYALYNTNLSMTYDSFNRIIMTWTNDDSYPPTSLFYALADATGTFITNPIPFRSSPVGVITAINGQGNAPYISSTSIEVSIDIKPGSATNPINTKSTGTIPVAILSTSDFDAPSMVDKTSLTFGVTGDESSLAFCNKAGEDVNGDGLLDQVCHFKSLLAHFQIGDAEGILTGQTVDDISIRGRDVVRIVK